jgi:hypothetical protein
VLASCYGAAAFDPKHDPWKIARDANTKMLKQLKSQHQTAARLRNFFSEDGRSAKAAAALTFKNLKNKGIDRRQTAVATGEDLLHCILDSYVAGLSEALEHAESDPKVERFLHGCLIYPTPLDKSKRHNFPKTVSMLLFDLVQTFRLRSEGISVRSFGDSMPRSGDPHFPLAAAFVNATFPTRQGITSENAENRLKRLVAANPRVGMYRWPHQPD